MNIESKQTYKAQLELVLKNRQVIQCQLLSNITTGNFSDAQQIELFSKVLFAIGNWLSILNENERTVILLHLCYHNSWIQVAQIYEQMTGENDARTERTLRSYQKQGLNKIVQCFSAQISQVHGLLPKSSLIYH